MAAVVHYAVFSPGVGLIDGLSLPESSTPEDALRVSRDMALRTLGERATEKLYAGAFAFRIQET